MTCEMAAFLACNRSMCSASNTHDDSASCRWSTDNVAKKLGVRYQAVTAPDGYLTLLHDADRAAIPRYPSVPGLPRSDMMVVPAMYRDFVHALLDFDDSSNAVVTLLTRKIKRGHHRAVRNASTGIGIVGATVSGSANGTACPSSALSSEEIESKSKDNPCPLTGTETGCACGKTRPGIGPTTWDNAQGFSSGLSSTANAASDKACGVTQHRSSDGVPVPHRLNTSQTPATYASNIKASASRTTGMMIGRPVASTGTSTTTATSTSSTQTDERQDVVTFISSLTECRKKIVKAKQESRWHCLNSLYDPGCDNMLRFITALTKLLRLSLNQQQIDEDAFRLLFLHFAWIFKIDMRLVNNSNPLVVQGIDVQSIPGLIYEKFPDEAEKRDMSSNHHEVFIVTVSKVKREENPSCTCEEAGCHDHQLRRRHYSMISHDSIEDDLAAFPDDLRVQHACQLVNELPKTHMPNKKCMLGFVVQATKVRLTCLIMSEEHRRLLELPDFEAVDSEHSAKIIYTRSYDMLRKEERAHLMQIMVTLAKYTGDIGDILHS